MLGGPGEEVRACVCPPHPGPSSPVDLSAQCCCGVALCFNCRQDGGRTFPVGIAWRPQGSLKRQSRRASQAAPCPSPPLSRLPLPFASSLQVRAPLQAQASACSPTTADSRGQQWPLRCGPARVYVCTLLCLVSGPTYCATWPGVLLASRPVTAPSLPGPRLGTDPTTEVWLFKNEI